MKYEEKYKEALKVIESLYNVVKYQSSSDAFLTCQTIEKAFPELRESEDERIGEFLYKTFTAQYLAKDKLGKWHGEPVSNILAWLEKQGEKANDERYKWLEELMKADTIYQMAMNDEMVQEAKVKAVRALSKMSISKLLGFEKQGEQKLKEKTKVYDSMDDLIADAMIDEINESTMPESSKHNRVYWINSHRNKNIEWSEEDEKKRKLLIDILKVNHPNGNFKVNPIYTVSMEAMSTEELVDWLKSLKDRVQPQSKQE